MRFTFADSCIAGFLGQVNHEISKPSCMSVQRKLKKTSEALARSQQQAKQADAEAEQMEKAFRVLQHEVLATFLLPCQAMSILYKVYSPVIFVAPPATRRENVGFVEWNLF